MGAVRVSGMKSVFNKIFNIPVYIHLLVMIILSLFVLFGALKYIDRYTNHNQAVKVPDIRGLQIEEAAYFLEQNMLQYIIIDSIYSKEERPGSIRELTPEAYSLVKKNRIIYITINSKTEKTMPIPELMDISGRQSYSELIAHGFKDVVVKYVPGQFKDLTVGVEYAGKLVPSGTLVPVSGTLMLVLQDGNASQLENENVDDEKKEPVKSDESWFE